MCRIYGEMRSFKYTTINSIFILQLEDKKDFILYLGKTKEENLHLKTLNEPRFLTLSETSSE
jgi:hypothetical protein